MNKGLFSGLAELGANIMIWGKAKPVPGLDPREWRVDDYGNLIRWQDMGSRDSEYGWERDHYPVPKALGGGDEVDNMRPLHWRANARHGGLLGAAKTEMGGLFGLLPEA